ncbi:MAG: AMP-binding protein [Candidatus Rokuibacteriota bacterium]|nr:MAG: AMP-binding protein [Candidatus Rokubacteria bacterium]
MGVSEDRHGTWHREGRAGAGAREDSAALRAAGQAQAVTADSPLTLGQILDEAAERHPLAAAVIAGSQRLRYRELRERVDVFARGLLALGLGPGDHVVVWMPNCIEWNVVNFALAKIGAVTVTCNSRYRPFEVEYLVGQSDARALVMMDRFPPAGVNYNELVREVVPDVMWRQDRRLFSPKFPELRHVIVLGAERDPGCLDWADVEQRGARVAPGELERIRVRPDDPAEMLYTSGTTGQPKGCLLSHGTLWYKARVYLDLHAWTADDRSLVAVPYFHIFGDERVTIFSGVPTMFITILGHPRFQQFDLRSLRTGTIGAAPVPIEMMRRILDRENGLGMDATVVYGLTEATGGTHFTRLGDPIDKRVSTVGRVTPELEDRIVDPTSGRVLGAGEEGEVCVKGPSLMLGYYKQDDATAEKIRDGWLHTGDMGVKDAEGYLRITGRLTDMIIVGGFNTYPAEIENFYLRHPRILDVSIVGVPDPVMGESVMAFVIPKSGETLTAQEIVEFARGTIANFKVPKHVEIVSEFPLTGSGKVQKFKQKAWAIERYGLRGPQ